MRSIDNLRDYVLTAPSVCSTTRAILVGYIDNIDREVAEVRDREYRNGMEDGEMAAERDGWVRLPVDADGVPIHVGDVMEWDNGTFTVHELKVTEDGWTTWDEQHGYTVHADECRHNHAPTVEDVLREFFVYAERGKEHRSEDVDDAVLAQYAAKLRLAGDDA